MGRCPNCGSENDGSTQVCPYCGAALGTQESTPSAESRTESPDRSGSDPRDEAAEQRRRRRAGTRRGYDPQQKQDRDTGGLGFSRRLAILGGIALFGGFFLVNRDELVPEEESVADGDPVLAALEELFEGLADGNAAVLNRRAHSDFISYLETDRGSFALERSNVELLDGQVLERGLTEATLRESVDAIAGLGGEGVDTHPYVGKETLAGAVDSGSALVEIDLRVVDNGESATQTERHLWVVENGEWVYLVGSLRAEEPGDSE